MKIKTIVLTMCLVIMAAYNAHAQTQTGYRVPAGYDCGNGARVTSRMNFQIGTGSTFIMRYGTTTVTGSGTAGYMMGTDSAYPRWVWTPATNRMNFLDIVLQQNGVDIAAYGNSAALAAALSDETGTNTVVFSSSPTLTGNINFPSGIWNSSGSVGIGMAAPSSKLQVEGAIRGTTSETDGMKFGFGDSYRYGIHMPVAGQVHYTVHSGLAGVGQGWYFSKWDGASTYTPYVYIAYNGNVGIGTNAPAAKLDIIHADEVGFSLNSGALGSYSRFDMGRTTRDLTIAVAGSNDNFLTGTVPGDAAIRALTSKLFLGDTSGIGIVLSSGNVGIGTTTPSNILTLPIASATDPIADAWTNHCLADYKDIGTETVEMIQSAAKDKIKNTPVSIFTKKAIITDEEAEQEPKQKYLSKMDAEYKADLKVFGSSTAVAMQDTSYIAELFDSMWDTKADRLTIVEANKQKLTAEKKALPKFQRKNYGIVAEDAPPEAQVLREDGSLQGVDPSVLISILWANAQKQEERISALETKIEQLKAIINP